MASKDGKHITEKLVEEEVTEPVSPTGQYFNSSALSVCVLGVIESEIPIDDSQTITMLQELLLPMSPRFSSIMVTDENGVKHWKRVEVNLEDHVNFPVFPADLSPESYDGYVQNYLSKIAMEQLPQSRPLWDIHLIKYPISSAAGMVVVKLHHAMGDGFSLMGAIFSCLKRADDPSLPLTFPSQKTPRQELHQTGSFSKVPRFFSMLFNTGTDFVWSLLKSSLVEDGKSPVRSAAEGVEFRPIEISTITFSLDDIRQIKAKVGGTINDVITGIVFYGIQLFMQSSGHEVSDTQVTALILLSTRVISGYQSLKQMKEPGAKSPWGNQFGFMHVGVPLTSSNIEKVNPLDFISQAGKTIKNKRNSLAVYLTGQLLEFLRRIRGPEATAQYIHATLKKTSLTFSNLIGPIEKMGIAGHPINGFYFMVVGVPQSLTVTLVSYNGKLRLAIGTEKGFINSKLLISCMETAFERISEAALNKPGASRFTS
ncbi:wax ester synthase/diacylglycerol acyltransferase 4-like [Aristolochia californica]|uniref:wax ester synthase/diacylglycerol acyltransferase 4-like n=1 Tax=Aristolochia californica TaxID=171875 RepID=UPI0035E25A4B